MNRHPNARVGPSLFSMGGLFFPSHIAVVFDDPSLSFVFLFSIFFFFQSSPFLILIPVVGPSNRRRAGGPFPDDSSSFFLLFAVFASRGGSPEVGVVRRRESPLDCAVSILFSSLFSVLHDDDGWMEKTRGSRALAATRLSSQ